MEQTPLTVGSPQQVIDRTLGFREIVGDYQRQLFLVDHAGLPQSAVLEQLEMLGERVVPVLRREFATGRPAGIPDAPVHPRAAAVVGAGAVRSADDRGFGVTGSRASGARSIVVVTAGLGVPSSTRLLADRLGVATERHLREAGIDPTIEIVELRDHAQDLINNLLTGFPAPKLQAVVDSVVAADGLIAVTPIFNASYSGLFKLFFDVLERDGLAGKPTLVAATGGTARHSLAIDHALRPLFAYLNAAVVATGVYAAAEDWGASGVPADAGLVARIDRGAAELATAMAAREASRAADPFADPVPFDELLRADPPGS